MNKTLIIAAACSALSLGASVASAQTPYRFFRPLPVRVLAVPPPTATATSTTQPAQPRPGSLACSADENGAYARSTFVVLRGTARIASGTCGSPVSLPAGSYDVVLTLETALDRPSRTVRAHVPEDGRFHATASFATAILEVRFTSAGRDAAGIAVIRRDGREIGTLGSGIPARVSAGRYEVTARYRTAARSYTVDLVPEQRRALRAAF
jgi:hypothetical protein